MAWCKIGDKPSYEPLLMLCQYIAAIAGLIGLRPANERQRYKVTLSLIGWAQT